MTRAVIEQRKREAIALVRKGGLSAKIGLASPRQGWGTHTKIITTKQGMSQ